MRNSTFGRRGLLWILVTVMALALPGARPAWAVENSANAMLSTQLPHGVSLRAASTEQLTYAVRAAVKANPEMAVNIVRAAILSKTPRHEDKQIDFKDAGTAPCDIVRAIVRAAIDSDPDAASSITQMALSLDPQCADALNDVANDDPNDLTTPYDYFGGFGAGFGPGFPGSPGFTGSPPSGTVALPPIVQPESQTVNG